MRLALLALIPLGAAGVGIPVDLTDARSGPITVTATADALTVRWPDESGRPWTAEFSLDPAKPLITAIAAQGRSVIERARPAYWIETGKRRGGWDEFFDFPPSHPEGTRRFIAELRPRSAKARTIGDRLEVLFDGLTAGPFTGGIAYTFYPGSRLVQQEAVASTSVPDTAYFYDAGLRMAAASADIRPGGNIETRIVYYGTDGHKKTATTGGPERQPLAVRHRALATPTTGGSVVVFPAPHQYFFARDFTTNMEYLWSRAWRGEVGIGVRQLPDDNSPYYPWMNAPPGTAQRMSLFYLLSTGEPGAALDEVLRYTHSDRFVPLPGYKTLAAHWHYAYTVQAMERGFDWTPPFKPVLKAMGVDAAMINDFHGDGHPRDRGDLRLKELEAYYRACRAQSDAAFLLIPAEEANVHLGGHWSVTFPKQVLWIMGREDGEPFRADDPKHGVVYRTRDSVELLDLLRRENGLAYQTHPRTKGSLGYPDKIRETEYFRDAHWLGAGWKQMPSDLSSPRLGERSLKLVDDMQNWGLHKRLIGEVDVFQIDATHELYAHMNVNYVRMPSLPGFDAYGQILEALSRGDYFISTGEVLMPEVHITPNGSVRASVKWTFPLRFAELVYGNGDETRRKIIPLDSTREFGESSWEWRIDDPDWKWARVAVWDIAGNGAIANPVRR